MYWQILKKSLFWRKWGSFLDKCFAKICGENDYYFSTKAKKEKRKWRITKDDFHIIVILKRRKRAAGVCLCRLWIVFWCSNILWTNYTWIIIYYIHTFTYVSRKIWQNMPKRSRFLEISFSFLLLVSAWRQIMYVISVVWHFQWPKKFVIRHSEQNKNARWMAGWRMATKMNEKIMMNN